MGSRHRFSHVNTDTSSIRALRSSTSAFLLHRRERPHFFTCIEQFFFHLPDHSSEFVQGLRSSMFPFTPSPPTACSALRVQEIDGFPATRCILGGSCAPPRKSGLRLVEDRLIPTHGDEGSDGTPPPPMIPWTSDFSGIFSFSRPGDASCVPKWLEPEWFCK